MAGSHWESGELAGMVVPGGAAPTTSHSASQSASQPEGENVRIFSQTGEKCKLNTSSECLDWTWFATCLNFDKNLPNDPLVIIGAQTVVATTD